MTATLQRPYLPIVELADGETGGIRLRGGNRALWACHDHEQMLSGPAETGKTYGWCVKLNALLCKYPGAHLVMARAAQVDLWGSVFRTWCKVTGTDPLNPYGQALVYYGGQKPEWVDYPNGSRLWFMGMDHPGKALSSERDGFYINQAEETTLDNWETLLTRTTGRGAVMPWTFVVTEDRPSPSHRGTKITLASSMTMQRLLSKGGGPLPFWTV